MNKKKENKGGGTHNLEKRTDRLNPLLLLLVDGGIRWVSITFIRWANNNIVTHIIQRYFHMYLNHYLKQINRKKKVKGGRTI